MMELGSAWVLFVAERVAAIDGASRAIADGAPAPVLPLLALGMLWTILWRGRLRWAGLAAPAAALVLWLAAERPALLVADTGGVMGVLGPEGRALSTGTAEAFVTERLAGPRRRPRRARGGRRPAPAVATEGGLARAEVGGATVLLVRGERALAALPGCGGADLLCSDQSDAGARPCLVLDATDLRDTGAVAGWTGPDGLRLVTAAALAGDRPWTRGAPPPDLPRSPERGWRLRRRRPTLPRARREAAHEAVRRGDHRGTARRRLGGAHRPRRARAG